MLQATIGFTIDGSTPSETAGTVYIGGGIAVNASGSTTIKAIAYESGYTDSAVATAIYTVEPLSITSLSPMSGAPGVQVTISGSGFGFVKSIRPTIWEAPLESLYEGLAAAKPSPAGVTAAAVSARLGLALLIKTLEITARRSGDAETVRAWITASRRYSDILAEAANDDIVAAAERKRIEIPMNAARAAVGGLDLCSEAAGLVRGPLAADLGAAAALLCAAVRAIVLCVDSNVGELEEESRRELVRHALARLEMVLRRISEALNSPLF